MTRAQMLRRVDWLADTVERHKAGEPVGVYSVCSAHPMRRVHRSAPALSKLATKPSLIPPELIEPTTARLPAPSNATP